MNAGEVKCITPTFNQAVEIANSQYLAKYPEIRMIHHLNKTLQTGTIEPVDSKLHGVLPNSIFYIGSLELFVFGELTERIAQYYSNNNGLHFVVSGKFKLSQVQQRDTVYICSFQLNQWRN